MVHFAIRRLPLIVAEGCTNLRANRAQPRILMVRQFECLKDYNEHFLDWMRVHRPEAMSHFRFARAPRRRWRLRNVNLVLLWVQDPVKERFPRLYENLKRLERVADASGINIVNRVDAMSNSIKARAAELMTAAGIRTPRMFLIVDVDAFIQNQGGLRFPLIVRENQGHGGMIHLIHNTAELAAVNLRAMRQPVAIEFVDTRHADGLFRKYRYVVMGDGGAQRHCIISDRWEVRAEARVFNDATKAEELAYLSNPVPPADIGKFRRAATALGMEVVALDYSFTTDGEMIIWEANPAAVLGWDTMPPELEYQLPSLHHLYSELLNFYFTQAKIPA